MNIFFRVSILCAAWLISYQTDACTAFCLKNSEQIIMAKNLDWPVDQGMIFVNSKGLEKHSLNHLSEGIFWTSKYASITFSQFGKEFPLGGMNEAGLVIEELNTAPFTSNCEKPSHVLNEFQVVQFILDNCIDVEDVTQCLDTLCITSDLISLHYMVADRSGGCIILEPAEDGLNIHRTKDYPVLSNNPYLESLNYLKNFNGFGGELPVLNRKGSNERFVFATGMLSKYEDSDPLDYSFAIMDSVAQEDTQWSIVYDLTHLKIHFRHCDCSTTGVFDFSHLDFDEMKPGTGCKVPDCKCDNTKAFNILTAKDNSDLVRSVVEILKSEPGLTYEKLAAISRMEAYGREFLPEGE